MCQENVEIDMITFIALLQACSHAGLVDEGLHYFESMGLVYNISSALHHYACVVDLLGCAVHEAEDLITMMPCVQNAAVWNTLLGACRNHGDAEMGEQIARKVLELDPGSATGYVLLTNIYAAGGKWDLSVKVQQQRLEKAVKKQPWVT
jgi:pentatricopeptide repeat protein